jgi:hypothetical protein
VDPEPLLREERPLEMHPQDAGAAGIPGKAAERREEILLGCGDEGGQV